MAIHKLLDESPDHVVLDGATVTILGEVALEAPKAASLLSAVPAQQRLSAIEDFLEHGAATAAAVQSSAHVVLLENKIAELTATLTDSLSAQLATAGSSSAQVTAKLLAGHKEALTRLLTPLTDPNNSAGLPAVIAGQLDRANKAAMDHIAVMLAPGEDGALGKAVKHISDEIKSTTTTITTVIAERDAMRKRSNRKGDSFEDVLATRLPILVRGIGRAEHCARTRGAKDGKSGDYLVTVQSGPGTESVAIAVEAKSRDDRLSANAIRSELLAARANRGAAAGVLVAESASSLPDGIGFGQVSERDFYVAFDPEDGNETALTCALYMAKVVALASVSQGTEDIDVRTLQRELDALRGLLQNFAKIETCHSRIQKQTEAAGTFAADLKAGILSQLRRLDSIVSGR